jgi:guanine nucleotide-binding protein subunit alpha
MEEAMFIFKQVANSDYFLNSVIILFFNKMDLFREKVNSGINPIRRYFPDYRGKPTDVEAGQEFFANKFKELLKDSKRVIHIYYTSAIDTTLLNVTMQSVQNMILRRNIKTLT